MLQKRVNRGSRNVYPLSLQERQGAQSDMNRMHEPSMRRGQQSCGSGHVNRALEAVVMNYSFIVQETGIHWVISHPVTDVCLALTRALLHCVRARSRVRHGRSIMAGIRSSSFHHRFSFSSFIWRERHRDDILCVPQFGVWSEL